MSGGMMPQASLGTSTMTTGSVGMPLMANGIGPAQGMQGMGMSVYTLPCLCSAFVGRWVYFLLFSCCFNSFSICLALVLVNHIFGIVLRRKVNIVGGAGGRFLFSTGHVVSSERQRLIQSQVIICVCNYFPVKIWYRVPAVWAAGQWLHR